MLILVILTATILWTTIIITIHLPKILKELKSLTLYLEDTLFKPKKISAEQKKINKKIEKENEKFRKKQWEQTKAVNKIYNKHFDGGMND